MTNATLSEPGEKTTFIAKAQVRVTRISDALKLAGVNLSSVANLGSATSEEFLQVIASLSMHQTLLLRDLFDALLHIAAETGDGEVVLTSIVGDTLRLVAKNSGRVLFIRDLLEVDLSVKKLEANVTAKNSKNDPQFVESLRRFKQQVESGAGEIASRFVA